MGAQLKNFRLTLQETIEDDATGKGSSSRLVMVMSALTLCSCLCVALVYFALGHKDLEGVVNTLIVAVAGGGSAVYTFKRVAEVLKGNKAQSDAPSTYTGDKA